MVTKNVKASLHGPLRDEVLAEMTVEVSSSIRELFTLYSGSERVNAVIAHVQRYIAEKLGEPVDPEFCWCRLIYARDNLGDNQRDITEGGSRLYIGYTSGVYRPVSRTRTLYLRCNWGVGKGRWHDRSFSTGGCRGFQRTQESVGEPIGISEARNCQMARKEIRRTLA